MNEKQDTTGVRAYRFPMGTTLKSIPATVSKDCLVKLSEPLNLSAPAAAMLTIAIDENNPIPNRATRDAMKESVEELERFGSVDALKAALAR